MSPPRRPRDALEKARENLSPEELFDLLVAAGARGDAAEVRRIYLSVPKVVYRGPALGFEARQAATRALVDALVPELTRFLGWLQALLALGELEEVARAEIAKLLPGTEGELVEEVLAVRSYLISGVHRRLACVLAAFQEVCASHRLNPDEVLASYSPAAEEQLAPHREAISEAGSDPAMVDAYRSFLTRAWEQIPKPRSSP